jgi:hypothetical protein
MVAGRMLRRFSPQVVVIKAVIIGYLPTSLLLWGLVFRNVVCFSALVTPAVYCFIVYTSFAYVYFHFFNTSETARRVRILYEIYRSGYLTLGDIIGLYKTVDVISLRLERLMAMNQLKAVDGYYELSGRTLYYVALAISLWRSMLGFEKNHNV